MEITKLKKKAIKLAADSLTPVGIYLRLRDSFSGSVLLESSDYHARDNSFSYICCEPIVDILVEQGRIKTRIGKEENEDTFTYAGEVLPFLIDFTRSFKADDVFKETDFTESGFFGYTTYDGVQFFEQIEFKNQQQAVPLMRYHFFRYVLVFDHFRDELYIIQHNLPGENVDGLQHIKTLIFNRGLPQFSFEKSGEETSNFTDEDFLKVIEKGKEHCRLGDVFQIVLSRKFQQSYLGDEFNVYRALRSLNPSPYLFYFDFGSYRIFGSSPEAQLIVNEGRAIINPIAGTYRRSGSKQTDRELAEKLLQDKKENAEHVMLVDLARNDLGRNGQDVKVDNFREIQYFSHVIHLVSKVSAAIPSEKSCLQIAADTFPAGTLSGAPKYRAMQLIDQYEPQSRGVYGGAIGIIGLNNTFNHAIVIRSFLSKDNTLHFQAGAGVVAASDSQSELQEVHNKLEALRNAMSVAETLLKDEDTVIG